MIATLNGKLTYKNIGNVVVDVNGVGFDIKIPLSTYDKLPELKNEVLLYIHTHITENSISLYGFMTQEEKKYFLLLIPVNKIGPKVAMSILSFYDFNKFTNLVLTEEIKELSKVPGLGKKTTERLILELKDKLNKLGISFAESTSKESIDNITNDAVMALNSLGFNYKESLKAVQSVKKANPKILLEDLIVKSLNKIKS